MTIINIYVGTKKLFNMTISTDIKKYSMCELSLLSFEKLFEKKNTT